jgi:hypothetical protein
MADEPASVDEREVAAIFARLRAQVRAAEPGSPGPAPIAGAPAGARLRQRDEAERYWPVTAERGLLRRAGPKGALLVPVKRVLRKLMRWYVEPPLADQRQFNLASLAMLDELTARVAELERRERERTAGTDAP